MCECLTYGHDEFDSTVAKIAGHHPTCPNFAINKVEFTDNLHKLAQNIAKTFQLTPKNDIQPEPKPKKQKLTEAEVQIGLYHHLLKKGHKIVAPNINLFYTGEMDVCSIMKSNLVNEYEIKLSRADFKKDFKKERKHPIFNKILDGIESENISSYSGRFQYSINYTSANYFHFVTPKDLIKIEEVPAYAGLIYFDPDNFYDLWSVKKARKLHSTLLAPEKLTELAKTLMWRCWTAKQKVTSLLNLSGQA